MKNKKIVFTFFLALLLFSIYFFGVLWVYDPLKIFHKPWKYKEYLQWDMRQQAAGIINNWEFDSIILGTSILECTSAKEASRKMGGKFVNLSLAGSYFYERAVVLKYALEHKQIKKVLYSLDTIGLVSTGKSDGTFKIENWDYLYDNNPFNDVSAYMNDKYIKCLFSPKNKIACMGAKLDFDRPNTWHTLPDQARRFGGLDNWFLAKDDPQIENAFRIILNTIIAIKHGKIKKDRYLVDHIAQSKEYIDTTVLTYIKKYTDTEFILVLPPYSRMQFALDTQYNQGEFERYKASVKYLVLQSSKVKNMSIYGWGNYAFVEDISNYKDLQHYEYKINSWMLDSIQRKEGLLTSSNVDVYLAILTQKSLDYNLFELGDKITYYLNNTKKN